MRIILLTLFVLFARVAEAHIVACYENGKLVFDENCFTSKTAAIDGIQMDAEQNGKVYDLSGGWCLESGKVFTSRMDVNMFRIHSHAIAKVIIF